MTKAKIASKKPAKTKKPAKAKPARILFVLDRSQSMGSIKNETIAGFNNFIADQRKIDAPTRVSLVQFNHEYQVTYADIDIHKLPDLNSGTYQPSGWTALYDAVGYMITSNKDTGRKGELTVLAVLTDGEENRSREYTFPAVQALLKEAQDVLGWEVQFLGANIDAHAVGGSLGMKAANTMTFDATAKGMSDAYATASISTMNYRGFTPDLKVGAQALGEFKNSKGEIDVQALYNALKGGASIDGTKGTAPSVTSSNSKP